MADPRPHVLLTGATGLLGRYLIRDLSALDVPLAVLVRPSRKASAVERIDGMLRFWAEEGFEVPRPKVLSGDILSENLGLSGDDRMWAAEHCDSLLHNAASLSFVSTGRQSEPWRSNVDGTRNVLEFCRDAAIRKFHHVSTAYVAGKRTGRVMEGDLDVGQEFGNPYEESKLQAETMVKQWDGLETVSTYRPGIIVGDSRTGFTSTFHNFYAFLQIAATMRAVANWDFTGRANASAFAFNTCPHDRKHIVTVDWVSAAMARLIADPTHHGRTYHLTPRVPLRVSVFRDVIEESLGYYGVRMEGAEDALAGEMSGEIEQMFMEQQKVYDSYWRDDPIFDCTNILEALPDVPCPHVDRDMMLHLANVVLDMKFRFADPKPAKVSKKAVPAAPPVTAT